jgi:hypothetical protein
MPDVSQCRITAEREEVSDNGNHGPVGIMGRMSRKWDGWDYETNGPMRLARRRR